MGRGTRKIVTPPTAVGIPALPPCTPAWITPELVADTLDCWQPYYANALTVTDAIEILSTVDRLFEALGQGDAPENKF